MGSARDTRRSFLLTIPRKELQELRDFDIQITLSSSSGVEQGDKACAVLRRIQVQAK